MKQSMSKNALDRKYSHFTVTTVRSIAALSRQSKMQVADNASVIMRGLSNKHSKFQLHPDVAAAPPPTATSPVRQRVRRYVEQWASVWLCDVRALRGLTLMLKV